ncbi:MAG: Heavy metal translocating P-type ATPase [Solirubrobacterales bacterium]|nr:Heavy metal translocating P-type ATPase [Solirubrobacterales bacterium]
MLPMAPASAAGPERESPVTVLDAAQRFRVDGMDCAACARTVETSVASLDGVRGAQVSFGTATLLVDGDVDAAVVESAVRRAGYRASPAGRRSTGPQAPFWRRDRRALSMTGALPALVAAVIASLAGAPRVVGEPLYLLSMGVAGWPIALAALNALRRRSLDMNVLMGLAALGAVGIGDDAEGAWVLVLFGVGTTLEGFALERSRRSVEALMELAPDEAHLLVDGVEQTVAVDSIGRGASLVVRPGERLPLDGVIVDGASSLDESALTGEWVPVDKQVGDDVFAGTLNTVGAMTIRVTAAGAETTLARVTQLVAAAQGSRAPAERFVDRFAGIYTPLVFLAALLVAVVPLLFGGEPDSWTYRALTLLIVACPCALVISVPVAIVSAVGGLARAGVLIKGGDALEALGRVEILAIDKTGTLTLGTPQLVSTFVADGADEDDVLAAVAALERGSEHPLGQALSRAADDRELTLPAAEAFTALPGRGAQATVGGRRLWAGGPRLARERARSLPDAVEAAEVQGHTPVVLGEDDRVLAVFGLADQPRGEAPQAMRRLRENAGVRRIVMLTGDSERVARSVAEQTGITEWRAGLLPEEKLEAVRELQQQGSVAMVGDGINDAPALAAADIGIAMGAAGSDVALESADVALMADELERLPQAIGHSRSTLRIIRQNVVASLAVKAVFVVLAPIGVATLVMAVVADMGMSLLVTLNSLRLLRVSGSSTRRGQRPRRRRMRAWRSARCRRGLGT